jgi:hypothetical protein
MSPAHDVTHRLHLQDLNAVIDLHTFQSHFTTIYQQKHQLTRNIAWPLELDLHTLVEKLSGSFIFVFTLTNVV